VHKACEELGWNYMNTCHRISWEGHDVGSVVEENLLTLPVTLASCSASQRSQFIETKILLESLIRNLESIEKLFYGS